MLKVGTAVDATLIAAPGSTKNSTGERDPEMHQIKKGNQCVDFHPKLTPFFHLKLTPPIAV
jgi:hypothetical protein